MSILTYKDLGSGIVLSSAASLTAQNTWNNSDGIEVDPRRPFNVSVSGTFSATVTLQRSFDAGLTWLDVWTTTEAAEELVDSVGSAVLWRLGVKTGGFTSGTAAVRIYQ